MTFPLIEIMSEAHEKPLRQTRTSSAYGTQLTDQAREVHKRVSWWDQPKSYMVDTETKTKSYMSRPTKTKSSMTNIYSYMTNDATTMKIQTQGSTPSNCTALSSRNGIKEILNRLSFLV